ncbi:MAG: glycosyltransferase [Gemmatimonadetes bacterium]|nr:glycosyltransferase [Gemmatimonadota bacterium]
MKLALYNTNPAWGGGERWFLDAASALEARGHEVVCIGSPGTPLFDRWGREACTVGDALRAPGAALPDLVLANSGREVRTALRTLSRSAQTRIVLRRGIDRPLRDNWVRRRSWRRLSGILVNSDATGRTVREALPWFPGDRIRRIYNPVTLEARPRRTDSSAFDIGAVARLVRQKGIDVLLEALARAETTPAWRLTIAGDGAERGALEEQAGRLGLADRVEFRGHVDDVARFYAGLDLLVVPSRYEGFGFVAVEGALAGLPVIASRVSSLPEVVADGTTGRLVPPEDPSALAAAIEAVAEDVDLAARYGQAGRERARRAFSADRLYTELEAFLGEAARWLPVRDSHRA